MVDIDTNLKLYKEAYEEEKYKDALEYLIPVVDEGNSEAQLLLGLPLGNVDNNEAHYYLGYMYQEGHGVKQNYKTAVKYFHFAAISGNSNAQFALGAHYHKGKGVEIEKHLSRFSNYAFAAMWYSLAVEQGHSTSKSHLKALLVNESVLKKKNNLKDFLSEINDNDNKNLTLGRLAYNEGRYKDALEYLIPLAEKEFKEAQYNLGLMYQEGLGVKQNDKTALKWIRLAADGLDLAQYNLGLMYADGIGIKQNHKTSVKWFRKARLGIMYASKLLTQFERMEFEVFRWK